MIKEFREFIMKGSMLDMAVGIVMGLAFSAIIASLVKDILMPPIGMVLGKVDFSSLFIALNGQHYGSLADAQKAGAATINYGLFVNAIINFLIVSFVLFLLIRAVNRMRRQRVADPTTRECPYCLTAIPIKATRCAACTSQIEGTPGA